MSQSIDGKKKEVPSLRSAPEGVARASVFDGGRLNANFSVAVKQTATGTSTPPVWRSRHAHIHLRFFLTRGVAATCTPFDVVCFATGDRHLSCTAHKTY